MLDTQPCQYQYKHLLAFDLSFEVAHADNATQASAIKKYF